MEFKGFPKIARLSRECVVTEKIDGTNAQICITEEGEFLVGSRTRWITPEQDNHGFARWAYDNKEELLTLGVGHHFGEWWGKGINRGYGQEKKIFSLFNTFRWAENRPSCCSVVPILYQGIFDTGIIEDIIWKLNQDGSVLVPYWEKPEGIVVFHTAKGYLFKKTCEHDDKPKSIV